MSTSSKADRRGPRGGFTLVEALVALVVAGFLLPSLARALGGAWTATRTPMEMVSAMTLARDVAAELPVPAEARDRGFTVEQKGNAATVLLLPSDVAPAPAGTAKEQSGDLKPEATPSGMKLAIPKGFGGPSGAAASADVRLRRIAITVRTPSGRRVVLDSLRLGDAGR